MPILQEGEGPREYPVVGDHVMVDTDRGPLYGTIALIDEQRRECTVKLSTGEMWVVPWRHMSLTNEQEAGALSARPPEPNKKHERETRLLAAQRHAWMRLEAAAAGKLRSVPEVIPMFSARRGVNARELLWCQMGGTLEEYDALHGSVADPVRAEKVLVSLTARLK